MTEADALQMLVSAVGDFVALVIVIMWNRDLQRTRDKLMGKFFEEYQDGDDE